MATAAILWLAEIGIYRFVLVGKLLVSLEIQFNECSYTAISMMFKVCLKRISKIHTVHTL